MSLESMFLGIKNTLVSMVDIKSSVSSMLISLKSREFQKWLTKEDMKGNLSVSDNALEYFKKGALAYALCGIITRFIGLILVLFVGKGLALSIYSSVVGVGLITATAFNLVGHTVMVLLLYLVEVWIIEKYRDGKVSKSWIMGYIYILVVGVVWRTITMTLSFIAGVLIIASGGLIAVFSGLFTIPVVIVLYLYAIYCFRMMLSDYVNGGRYIKPIEEDCSVVDSGDNCSNNEYIYNDEDIDFDIKEE